MTILFYKADTTEHRQKLINIFPYVLGVVNSEILAARQEFEQLKKERNRLNTDLENIKKVSENWQQEIKSWLIRAHELGLTDYHITNKESFDECLKQLRIVSEKNETDSMIIPENIIRVSHESLLLRKEEEQISSNLFEMQQRYTEMNQLSQSKEQYDHSLDIQLNRLEVSKWLYSLANTKNKINCPICGSEQTSALKDLNILCNAIAEIEENSESMKVIPAAFEREMQIVKNKIAILSERLTAVRNRITEETKLNQNRNKKYTFSSIARFLGCLETSLQTYDKIGDDSVLQKRLSEIDDRLKKLNEIINEEEINRKIRYALDRIQLEAGKIIADLDAERPNDPIEIVIQDLTIRIKNSSGRNDYLWEIGSASNWLAYHISIILAFQKYFLENKGISIPTFVVFDQPSQVYFPQRSKTYKKNNDEEIDKLDDEDKSAVQKIFKTFSKFIESTNSKIQIIVMEHADEDVWGEIDKIHLVKRWRGNDKKLVPIKWLQ